VPIASAGRAKRGVKGHCDCGAAARPTAAHTGHSLRVQQKHELRAARQPSAWRQAAVSGGRGGLRQRRLESLGRPSRPALVAFARRRCHRERRTTAALEWPYSPSLGIIRGGVWRALDGASAGGTRRCRCTTLFEGGPMPSRLRRPWPLGESGAQARAAAQRRV
jgi:hypothetical protein